MRTIVFLECKSNGTARAAVQASCDDGFYNVILSTRTAAMAYQPPQQDMHRWITLQELSEETCNQQLNELMLEGLAIVAVISLTDPYVSLAAKLATRLSIARQEPHVLERLENKREVRRMTDTLPCSVAWCDWSLNDDPVPPLAYPFVLKPVQSTGSKSVFLVRNIRDWNRTRSQIQQSASECTIRSGQMPRQSHGWIAERYISGTQWLVEVFMSNGQLIWFCPVSQKLHPKLPVITGYCLHASYPESFNRLVSATVQSVMERTGYRDGSAHLEFRVTADGTMHLIEINPRPAGTSMNECMLLGRGIHLAGQTVRFHLGWPFDFQSDKIQAVAVHCLYSEHSGSLIKVTGRKRSSGMDGIRLIYIRPKRGRHIRELKDMGDRLGYVIATAGTASLAWQRAVRAARTIRFHLKPQKQVQGQERETVDTTPP